MMKEGRVQLFFREMSQIANSEGLSVIVLSDSAGAFAITIVCDEPMTQQLLIRFHHQPGHRLMLPEVLTRMLFSLTGTGHTAYETMTYDVADGQYKTVLKACDKDVNIPIRISDAILLNVFSMIPMYIDEELFRKQRSFYTPHTSGLVIPINTISLERLKTELQKAIAEENYRLASSIHEEIQKRNMEKRD
jgi:bifunctional DNase/RNase